MRYLPFVITCFFITSYHTVSAQTEVFNSNIKSIKLFKAGDQTSFPVITVNGNDLLQLEFD